MFFWIAIAFLFLCSGFVYRVMAVMFVIGFLLMAGYLCHIYIIDPVGCADWFLAGGMTWYWYIAAPFINGIIFAGIPTFLLGAAS